MGISSESGVSCNLVSEYSTSQFVRSVVDDTMGRHAWIRIPDLFDSGGCRVALLKKLFVDANQTHTHTHIHATMHACMCVYRSRVIYVPLPQEGCTYYSTIGTLCTLLHPAEGCKSRIAIHFAMRAHTRARSSSSWLVGLGM